MNLFTPNTDRIANFNDVGKYLLAWKLMLLYGTSFVLLTAIAIFSSIEEVIIYTICVLLTIISLIYLKRTQKFKFVYYFIAVFGCAIAFYTLNNFDKLLHIGDFLWLVLIIMFTFFGLGTKEGVIVLIFVLLNVIYYFLFSIENNINQITNLDLNVRIGLIIEIVTVILSIAYLFYQFIVIHDNSNKELQLANQSLKKQNEIITHKNIENTTLIQEVHHRVKNNLQIIISLLRLQKNDIQSQEAKESLSKAINRIMVMSLIHQKLYGTKSLSNIALKEYLKDLIMDIGRIYSENNVKLNIDSNYNVGLKTIVPLGILFNELVINSYKHGFKNIKKGEITIKVKQKAEKNIEIVYSDSGNWIEPKEKSFGLELIGIMTNQLEGYFERVEGSKTTTFIFFIKDIDEEDKKTVKEQLNVQLN